LARSQSRKPREAEALSDTLEAFVQRFAVPSRREVRRLMRSSPRAADLAMVFPGAMYVLATRRSPPELREQALALIDEGAPLRVVARVLDLPFWLRRLPPEAFQAPIPLLPSSELFARRIANRLPERTADSAFWLASVAFGARAAHEDFALWLAEQPVFGEPGVPEKLFPVLAAYAWFSGVTSTRAHSLIVVPWRAEIAFDTALCAAKSWLNRIRLVLQLYRGVLTDTWLAPGSAKGYSFVPLLDQHDILDEAHHMQNCADQYAERLSRDKCRLFSIRCNGARVATMEIGPHPRETGVLAINQLKGRHNIPASVDVWQAAHAWLAQQSGLKRLPPMVAPERPLHAATWEQLMAPYREEKAGAPWLPETASLVTFAALDVDMAELARRGAVSSWLFT
jgi:hypothetical protein